MKFWLDRESESKNVVVANEASFAFGSCDQEHYDSVEQQLKAGKPAAEVLGSEDLTVVPFLQIQNLTSRSTDSDVQVSYKAKKELKTEDLDFTSETEAQEFVDHIGLYLPEGMVKKIYQQSALTAAFGPLLSLLLGAGTSYLFFDKFRIVVYVVGALWMLASLAMLYTRVTNPPEITRFTVSGKEFRKAWNGLKTAGSFCVAALVIVGISASFPDRYGQKALYDQLYEDTLGADEVQKYVDRGANLNYVDEDGMSVLSMAMDWTESDVVVSLIEAGADLNQLIYDDWSPLAYAIYNEDVDVVKAMLDRGALQTAEIDGVDALEMVQETENDELIALVGKYRQVDSASAD
ncbi:MAG: ankyrin repeat domain-containing protein [Gammaproteobacteria bacterium]|nr:ankyrin repeat domain-containing protein [Gammaproteobacteria bacterium]